MATKLKLLLLVLATSLASLAVGDDHQDCSNDVVACPPDDYISYVACLKERQHRAKRSCNGSPNNLVDECQDADCDNCSDCDCDNCSGNDCRSNACYHCCETNCCASSNVCTNNRCCFKTCQSVCRTTVCRRECKKECYSQVSQHRQFTPDMLAKTLGAHNITTVINLSNLVNNTNRIDVPVNLRSVFNTTTATAQNSTKSAIVTAPVVDRCCVVVGPRQCTQAKCFHHHYYHCGDGCTSPPMAYPMPYQQPQAFIPPPQQAFIPQPQQPFFYRPQSYSWPRYYHFYHYPYGSMSRNPFPYRYYPLTMPFYAYSMNGGWYDPFGRNRAFAQPPQPFFGGLGGMAGPGGLAGPVGFGGLGGFNGWR